MFPINDLQRTIVWIITGVASLLVVLISLIIERNIAYFIKGLFPKLRSSRGKSPAAKPRILWLVYAISALVVIVGTAIASSAPQIINEPIVPIRIDTSFPALGRCGTSDIVLPPVDEVPDDLKIEDFPDWLYNRHDFINARYLEITATSLVEKEWVRIENRIRVKVLSYKQLSELTAVRLMCGGGQVRDFPTVQIDTSKNDFDTTFPEFDYFTLQPGEFEVFDLLVTASEAGEYEIEIGLDYSYKGKTETFWLPQVYKVFTPQKYITIVEAFWMPLWESNFVDGQYETGPSDNVIVDTESPETSTTETPHAAPTLDTSLPKGCKFASMVDLQIGDIVKVSTTDNLTLSLRYNPGTHASLSEKLKAGSVLEIIDGPTCKDGYKWWKVKFFKNNEYVIGWVAEGDSDESYLEK